jgi:hypothetical protein
VRTWSLTNIFFHLLYPNICLTSLFPKIWPNFRAREHVSHRFAPTRVLWYVLPARSCSLISSSLQKGMWPPDWVIRIYISGYHELNAPHLSFTRDFRFRFRQNLVLGTLHQNLTREFNVA